MDNELEKMKEYFVNEHEYEVDSMIEKLEQLTPFELGRYQGKFHVYDDLFGYIRNRLKYLE